MSHSSPPKPLKPHPGIRIEKIPVKGAAGLVFVFGIMFIFWVGVPTIRGFVILGAVGGLAATVFLLWLRNRDQGQLDRRLFTGATTSVSAADQDGRKAQSGTEF